MDKKLFNIKAFDYKEIQNYLFATDYGIILMNKNKDYETQLGVKYLEYIACNLKIITNTYVGLAVNITKYYNIGLVLNNTFTNIDYNINDKILYRHIDEFKYLYSTEKNIG